MKKTLNPTDEPRGVRVVETVRLKDIEKRAKEHNKRYESVVRKMVEEIRKKDLDKGRGRPKDPNETKILSHFKRK